MTNEERAEELAKVIASYDPECCSVADIATKLILAYADEIRRECAMNAERWFYTTVASADEIELEGFLKPLRARQIATLRAAILGTEPAREGS